MVHAGLGVDSPYLRAELTLSQGMGMSGKKLALTAEQLAMANLYRIEALIRLLERKAC